MTARKRGKGGGSGGGLPSYAIVLVAVAIAIGFFHNLGANPLTDRDEGAFSEATREMLESGNYVSTYLNGEPRYDKPILIYYLQAASVTVFGQNEWGFRFPSAVAGALWVLATWFFTRRWVDEGAGWVAGIIAATTLWVMALGRAAIADAVLNLFIVLACFEAFNYAQEQKRGQVWRFFLWTGLGFLTKGPIGVVIPAAVSFAYALFRWTPGVWFRALVSPVGWAIFLAINVPWYAAQYMAEGQAFIDGFFLRHNVSRFTDTMEGHGGSWFYYVPVLFLITLPWTGLLVRTLGRITDAFQEDLDLYLWTWFGLVFVLFSVSGTQLPHYIVPGITPLFILMARYRELFEWRVASLLPLAIVLVALAFFPELWPRVEPYVQDENAIAMISGRLDVFTAGYRIWLLLGLAALGALAFFRGLRPWQSLLGGALVFSFVLVQAVVPVVGEFIQGPTKEAALLAKENDWDVVMYSVDMPSFAVYYDRITPLRAPEPGEVAFTRSTRLHELEDVEVLYEKGIVVLARKLAPGTGESGSP
jgi:4-amino-4-deoxy-L-arabinose transferase-like glycosyltransferase